MVKTAQNLSPLRQWVLKSKFFVKTSEPKEVKALATHFLLDGGIWKIPKENYLEFLKNLATDLHAGEKHYISENRGDIFRFICDLDFYEETIISPKQVGHVVKVIQDIVEEYYGEQRVIVCGADSKTVKINETEFIKSGFHLVFPKVWITTDNAKKLRTLFIEKLIETFSERESHNKWEDVVDLAVYTDNGLRMVGCRKIGACKVCKNKKEVRDTCVACEGVGKKDENRVYKAVSVYPENNEYLKSIQNDYYILLLDTSIYNYTSQLETALLQEIPVKLEIGKKKTKSKSVPNGNELETKIENFIHKNFKEHYSKSTVTKVTLNKEDNMYYVCLSESDNYCMNVNRHHTSSGIYFQIKQTGISQRCYCKKTTTDGRLHGSCTTYCSKEIPLSKPFQKALFGTINGTTKSNKTIVNVNVSRSTTKAGYISNCKNILSRLAYELF
jgi:hypothetical protein